MPEQDTKNPPVLLYSRPDCHLCDVAAAMLDEENLAYRKHDIELDIDLISRYGTRIPVLYRSDSGEELGWPFSAGQARRFFER